MLTDPGRGPRMTRAESTVHRLVLVARALGFAVLTYFLPTLLRDLVGYAIPGGTLSDAFSGAPPWIAVATVVGALALSALFVRIHSRTGPDADRPRPLLRLNRRWLQDCARGLAIGAGAATITIVPMVLAGEVRITGLSPTIAAAPAAALGLVILLGAQSALEEFGFRGPAQRDLTRAVTFPVAAIFLAGSFVVMHAGNPDIGGRGAAGIFFAGLALAGLVRWRGDLSVAVGAHVGWNLAIGMIWSVPVSGFRMASRLLESEAVGSDAWTGGAFGVEGSIPGVMVLALATAVSWSLPQARESGSAGGAPGPAGGDPPGNGPLEGATGGA